MRRRIYIMLALMLCTAFGGCSRGASTTLKSGAEPDKDKDKEGQLRIKLWSTVTKKEQLTYVGPREPPRDDTDKAALPTKAILAVAFSRDNRTVVTATAAGPVQLVDRSNPNAAASLAGTAPIALAANAYVVACGADGAENVSLALRPDGKLLAIGGDGLQLVDGDSGELLAHLRDTPGKLQVQAVAFDSDGRRGPIVAAGSNLGFVVKVEENGRIGYAWRWHEIPSVSRQDGPISVTIRPSPTILRFTPDDKTLLAVHPGYPVLTRCDAETGKDVVNRVFSKPNNLTSFTAVALSTDGKLLAAAHSDGALRIWDVGSGNLRLELPDQGKSITPTPQAMAFSPDGNWLVAGRTDGTLRYWDIIALLKK